MEYEELIVQRNYEKLSIHDYERIHYAPLVPIDYEINIPEFEQQIVKYKKYRKQWGHEHRQFPRYGLPLVNLSGNIDDEIDPTCNPLDTWWRYTGELYWDLDFTKPTEILDLSCFDSINSLKPNLIRSNILWWDALGHFKPHVDAAKDKCFNIRVWGTNKEDYFLSFKGKRYEFEPGRLYIIDTSILHEARAYSDFTFTFFLSFNLGVLKCLNL